MVENRTLSLSGTLHLNTPTGQISISFTINVPAEEIANYLATLVDNKPESDDPVTSFLDSEIEHVLKELNKEFRDRKYGHFPLYRVIPEDGFEPRTTAKLLRILEQHHLSTPEKLARFPENRFHEVREFKGMGVKTYEYFLKMRKWSIAYLDKMRVIYETEPRFLRSGLG